MQEKYNLCASRDINYGLQFEGRLACAAVWATTVEQSHCLCSASADSIQRQELDGGNIFVKLPGGALQQYCTENNNFTVLILGLM